MTDTFSKKERSYIMSRIRSKNTKPEIRLSKELRKSGIKGFRMHVNVFGTPDIVFPKQKIAIFVDGCFWHKCPKHYTQPESNKKFWLIKIKRNLARDKKVNRVLKREGWSVIRIWEHELK